jgi:metal-sulfur cluster biosynthetic enzyme
MMTSPFLLSEDLVMAALKEVFDPELGVNVVDLRLVYCVEIDGDDITIRMTLTTPGCPLHDTLTDAVDGVVRYFNPSAGSVTRRSRLGATLEARDDHVRWPPGTRVALTGKWRKQGNA